MKSRCLLLTSILAVAMSGCLKPPVRPGFGSGGSGTEDQTGVDSGTGTVDPDGGSTNSGGTNPGGTGGGGTTNPDGTTNPGTSVKSTFVEKPIASFADIGARVNTSMADGVAITKGVIRPRRRHENDMDFAKFNPFYWEGREANFTVEDHTSKGEKLIKITLETQFPQNYIPTRGPDFSAIYKGDPKAADETTRSKFMINARMNQDNPSDFMHFNAVIDEGAFNAYADHLKKGDILTFEFRFFLDESYDGWKKEKAANGNTLSAYYSEFFRVKLGEPGLHLEDPLNVGQFPSPLMYSGGWLTSQMVKVEPWRALQQQAVTLSQEHSKDFLNGRTYFHTDFVDGIHVHDESDDKIATFYQEDIDDRKGYAASSLNQRSCNGCHMNNGVSVRPSDGTPLNQTLARTFDKTTGGPHKAFGAQLQTGGANPEGTLKVVSTEERKVTLGDGTVVTLHKPIYKIESSLNMDNLGVSIRRPMSLIGQGLLDAVPDDTIKSLVGRAGGEVRMIDGKIGRHGWKADKPTLLVQIATALRNDIGVKNEILPDLDCTNGCTPGKAVFPQKKMELIEQYLSLLGPPPRYNPTDPQVVAGEKIFRTIGCSNCHVPTLQTGTSKFAELSNQSIQPFTDLLVHNMGVDLQDDSGTAWAPKWRTPALWGLKNLRDSADAHLDEFKPGNIDILWPDTHAAAAKNRLQLLHDGRAESPEEAVLWHGGEALSAKANYMALPKADRDALKAFLWDI